MESFITDLIQVVINTLCNQREILDAHIEDVVEYFHDTTDYKGFKFDESQKGLSIFENLNVLTKGC